MAKKVVTKKPVTRLVEKCKWCDGYGYIVDMWYRETCLMCGGTGGKWETRMEVVEVREES